MADRLTQLQDCLDDLLMQMFAALNYIQTRHPRGEFVGQPSQAPQAEIDADGGGSTETPRTAPAIANGSVQPIDSQPGLNARQLTIKTEATAPGSDSQETFRKALRELAQDLVMQEQKTEILINSLPGLGTSERDQRRRMQELENELKDVEAERVRAEKDKADMLRSLDRLIIGLGRVR